MSKSSTNDTSEIDQDRINDMDTQLRSKSVVKKTIDPPRAVVIIFMIAILGIPIATYILFKMIPAIFPGFDDWYRPEQIHISLGANSTEMYVTWSTLHPVEESEVIYGVKPQKLEGYNACDFVVKNMSSKGYKYEKKIDEGDQSRRILYSYRAAMTNLLPDTVHCYQIVSKKDIHDEVRDIFSPIYEFRTLPDIWFNDRPLRMAIYGDLGVVNGRSIPKLIRDVNQSMYDVIFHNGDFAYDIHQDSGKVGDQFMRMIEPIAARVPYQTSVGNHESHDNFTHYDHRFTMVNSGGFETGTKNNFYYSFNLGPIHFVAISTEFYYFVNSAGITPLYNQYHWLEEDLRLANLPHSRLKRPWIIVLGHRPMYCSSDDDDDCNRDANIMRKGIFNLAFGLEKLFYNFGVDMLIWSHEHNYERFKPIYNRKFYKGLEPGDHYEEALAPIHLTTGSAGCVENIDFFMNRTKLGSECRIADYSYTRLFATREQLKFQLIPADERQNTLDEFTVMKTRQNFPLEESELKLQGNNGSDHISI